MCFAACASPKPAPVVSPQPQRTTGDPPAEFVISDRGVTRNPQGLRHRVQIAIDSSVPLEVERVLVANGRPQAPRKFTNTTFDLSSDATARDYWRVTVRISSQAWVRGDGSDILPTSRVVKTDLDRAIERETYYVERSFVDSIALEASQLVRAASGHPDVDVVATAQQLIDRLPDAINDVGAKIAIASIARTYPVAAKGLASLVPKISALREAARRSTSGTIDLASFVSRWLELQGSVLRPRETACDGARAFNAASNPILEPWWTFGVYELPATDAGDTIELAVDQKVPVHVDLRSAGNDLSVWAPAVPHGTDLTFTLTAGKRENLRVLDVVASVLPAVSGGIKIDLSSLKSQSALIAKDIWLRERPWNIEIPEQRFEARLRAFTSADACKDQHGDNGLEALATHASRVATLASLSSEPVDRDVDYSLDACKGPCSDATTVSHVQLHAYRRWSWTLLGALAYNLHVHGWHAAPFTSYQWQPATISNGAQLFQLEPQPQPLQSFSVNLLLAFRAPDNSWAFGFGPSLILGDGSGKLAQWTANAFWAPCESWRKQRVSLMAGAGFRIHDAPVFAERGDVAQGAMPPPLTQQLRAEAVVTFGFAFDLAVIGDAASSLFGTKPPGGPSPAASQPSPKKPASGSGEAP
jgi:hypothetical protein